MISLITNQPYAQIKKRLTTLLLMVLVAIGVSLNVSYAQSISTQQAQDLGKSLGGQMKDGLKGNITPSNAGNVVPSYNNNAAQSKYFQGGQGQTVGPGASRVAGCDNKQDLECQAVELLKKGKVTRPKFDVDPNDPLIGKVKEIQKNPGAITGDLFDVYESCSTYEKEIPGESVTELCSEYGTIEQGQCTPTQVVEVDVDYNYGCQKVPYKVDNVNCNRTLKVTCDPLTDGCDNGGIVPSSLNGDMSVRWGPSGGGNYWLEFGTIGDNYWGGDAQYDRIMNVNVANKDMITQFSLINVQFDDWLMVTVNDIPVYGYDYLELVVTQSYYYSNACIQNKNTKKWDCEDGMGRKSTFQYCVYVNSSNTSYVCNNVMDGAGGTSVYYRYLYGSSMMRSSNMVDKRTSNNFSVNIDIRPYLKNGINKIFTRTIVGGRGESYIRFAARQQCPRVCRDSWDNQCSQFEQRAK